MRNRLVVLVLTYAGCAGCGGEVAEPPPSLALSCRPTRLNAAEYVLDTTAHPAERSVCTVTPIGVPVGAQVIVAVDDTEAQAAASKAGAGVAVAPASFVSSGGCGDPAVDANVRPITPPQPADFDVVKEAGGELIWCFGCDADSEGATAVVARLPSRGDVVSQPVTFRCDNRDPNTFAITVRAAQPNVGLGKRVALNIEATDAHGGAHVANQMVLIRVEGGAENGTLDGANEAGDVQTVLVMNDGGSAEPASSIFYTCPNEQKLYRVTVTFADAAANGSLSASTFINCTPDTPKPEILVSPVKSKLVADGEDTTTVQGRVMGPDGPVGADPSERAAVTLCANAEAAWVDDTAEEVPCEACCTDCGEGYAHGERCSRLEGLPVDENGMVEAELRASARAGAILIKAWADLSQLESVLRATDAYPGGLKVYGELVISQVGIGAVRYEGAMPPVLGVKGSGFNESSQVCFVLSDTDANPFPAGVEVAFDIPNNSGDSVVGERGVTDSSGRVCTNLRAGRVATTLTVRARVALGSGADRTEVQVFSASIPIIGVTPNARGFPLECDLWNVGALINHDGLNSNVQAEIPCRTLLKDRFGNPVGQSTAVSFRTEAGSIGGSVNTVPLDVGADLSTPQPNVGKATVIFNTFGRLPKDVSPFAAGALGGSPIEPRVGEGLANNPRDGLVSIIAFVSGEEEFDDVNGNGVYDEGEPFVDLAEPFVDYNDNDKREDDEPFIDIDRAGHQPGAHDGENGVWDGHTIIWTQTRMIWTGHAAYFDFTDDSPSLDRCRSGVGDACQGLPAAFKLPAGGSCAVMARVTDRNLNLLNGSATYSFGVTGAQVVPPPPLPTVHDKLGIGWGKALVPVVAQPGVSRVRSVISTWGIDGNFQARDPNNVTGRFVGPRLRAASDLIVPGEEAPDWVLATVTLDVRYSTGAGGSASWIAHSTIAGCTQ